MRKKITSLSWLKLQVVSKILIGLVIAIAILGITALAAPELKLASPGLGGLELINSVQKVTVKVNVDLYDWFTHTKRDTIPRGSIVEVQGEGMLSINDTPTKICYVTYKDNHLSYVVAEQLYASPPRNRGKEVIDYSAQFLGTPYVWGGTTPSGFDCSGLVQYCYKHALGISLPRTTYEQRYSGYRVSIQSAKPGDVILMHGYNHVGLVVANNGDGTVKYIHAPHSGDVVKYATTGSCDEIRRIVD